MARESAPELDPAIDQIAPEEKSPPSSFLPPIRVGRQFGVSLSLSPHTQCQQPPAHT